MDLKVYPGKSDGDPDMDYKEVMYLSRSTTIDDVSFAMDTMTLHIYIYTDCAFRRGLYVGTCCRFEKVCNGSG